MKKNNFINKWLNENQDPEIEAKVKAEAEQKYKGMNTPMQELYDELKKEYSQSTDASFRDGLDFVVNAIKQDYLEKEKEAICEFAYTFETRNNLRSAEQVYNETFNTKEK